MLKKLLQLILASSAIMPLAVAQPGKVTIAATEWAPLTGAEMENDGLLSEITTAALKRVGYDPEIVILPWKRAYEMTKKGRYDALLGTSFLEERTADFIYPDYAWRTEVHFHALRGNREWKYKDLNSLCPATIGILIGSFHRKTLLETSCLKVQENNSIRQNLQMLMRGRIDLYLTVPDVLEHNVAREFPEAQGKIVTLQPAYVEDKAYLVFPRTLPRSETLAKDYERGIQLIQGDGTYADILRRHNITAKP
jgi:polar amino acid transport system substrate-binding protein